MAERIRAAAAVRIAGMRELGVPAPTLAAVAVDGPEGSPLFFDVKMSAFEHAGAGFQPHILPSGTTEQALVACIRRLNDDGGVHGIYVQYPLPAGIDAQRAYDEIDAHKDVDGAATSSFDTGAPRFRPATAEAVVRLLEQHAVPVAGRTVCIVRGDPLFARHLEQLFASAGASARTVDFGDTARDARIAQADITVVATGMIEGVRAAVLRDDTVAVDVGYYHGGGRGDIDVSPADVERLSAYAPARGAIGPLTVALLLEHTIDAAERQHAAPLT